ncbi:hypothetical protein ABZ747_26430 [Kitasatospora cineracea]|uniref:hypothetical protein n=1 Tax=Kitasatospora cineracea TaxID=88074 RepID=UPI003405A278
MANATPDREPDRSEPDGAGELSTGTAVLGWLGVAGLIYLLICAVSIISRGFAGLGGDAAHTMFAFAANPWVGLSVGVLGTVLIQSSTTTTAIAVTAVGSGALPIEGAVPIILGANVGTTVTTSLVALTFIGNRTEFRRALGASTVHDFYNWLALLLFFPVELIWHPLQRISRALTDALYGTDWLPNPAHFNVVRSVTRPVEHAVVHGTAQVSAALGPLFTIVIGAALILIAVRYRCTAPSNSPASPPNGAGSSASTSARSSSPCPPWSSCWWACSEQPSGRGPLTPEDLVLPAASAQEHGPYSPDPRTAAGRPPADGRPTRPPPRQHRGAQPRTGRQLRPVTPAGSSGRWSGSAAGRRPARW